MANPKTISGRVETARSKKNDDLQAKLKQQDIQIKALANKLFKVDRLQDEFLTVLSHELKTPMTSVLGYLWMTLNGRAGKLTKNTREYLKNAYGSAIREVKLVDDMLDASRIDQGILQIFPEPTQILPVAKAAIKDILAQGRGKNLKLKVPEPEQELPQVMVDPKRLKQIIDNLIDNAIKYTEKGGITVSFNFNGDFVETAVTDTGVGIAQKDIPRLFTKFGRLGNTFTSLAETAGTGLGLYLTKKLVELHQGKIWAGSEPGQGSTFTFSLPVAKS